MGVSGGGTNIFHGLVGWAKRGVPNNQ